MLWNSVITKTFYGKLVNFVPNLTRFQRTPVLTNPSFNEQKMFCPKLLVITDFDCILHIISYYFKGLTLEVWQGPRFRASQDSGKIVSILCLQRYVSTQLGLIIMFPRDLNQFIKLPSVKDLSICQKSWRTDLWRRHYYSLWKFNKLNKKERTSPTKRKDLLKLYEEKIL
jgi:hypothetical protein